MVTHKQIAERRGNRAAKLFPQGKMDKIIAAIAKEELHRADPTNPQYPGGRDDFYKACYEAIKIKDDDGLQTQDDVDGFITDLWNATWGVRGSHESRPCW